VNFLSKKILTEIKLPEHLGTERIKWISEKIIAVLMYLNNGMQNKLVKFKTVKQKENTTLSLWRL
jgi:hypothetical protein